MKTKKLFYLISILSLFACDTMGGGINNRITSLTNTTNTQEVTSFAGNSSILTTELLLEFENVSFVNKNVVYNGQTHCIFVENVPEGTNILYENNDQINVGSYKVKATLSKSGYKTVTLEATLVIAPAEFSNVTFVSQTIDYDGKEHSITITGSLPEGSEVTYSSEQGENKFTEPGSYEITATITNPNFKTLILKATLTIESTIVENLYSYVCNDVLYFQNALDKDKLYTYDENNGVKKISSDKSEYLAEYNGYIYFVLGHFYNQQFLD